MNNVELGRLAEDFAVSCLEKGGIRVLERNYRLRGAEIDIVSEEGQTLVFTEVKYRSSAVRGTPAAAVDGRKQKKICSAALHYVGTRGLTHRPVRFDVIEVTGGPGALKARRIRNAFDYCGY